MTRKSIIWGVMVLGCTVQVISTTFEDNPQEYMSKEDREMLKEEARDMFYHAYNAYMDNAYPADELMPLSCKGRYRNSEPDRGDIDSTLGNFSLTLVDTLDTLVVLGDLGEFENAVRLVVRDVTFDTDVIVSLFETNIRMLGGLLSGHILAEYLQSRADIMPWYRGELLNLAKDLGYRFLPAFNTTTGIPFGRINLRHGMKGVPAEMCRETCTACAGSMILEMAALSRLTGESIFEDKAQKAMDALWKMRHRGTDLMGSVLNVHSGDWVRRDSGVGAGIDSYYEYCLKAYILLGDEKYLGRFNKHYQAVMKYVSQGPMLLDVHMHRPNTNSKNFMDALLAFWPGLQVLKGDIKPAVETHEMLYQVMQRHNFIPEAFTTDFQVHWGHHPLRPEFLESTYFLYRATGDHYYLEVGRKVLKSLQTYARVLCGYAAVSDVRTNKHDDTMDSFVLSETLKYLYLLFAEPSDLVLDLDEFIFTTEGHLLPLSLAALRTNVTSNLDRDVVQVDELGRTCPNSLHLFPASVRQPLRNMVEDVCPRRSVKRRLSASQFQPNNLEHLKILSNMGITILTPTAGQVQVLHTFSNARTAQDAEEGLLFMQEMVELSKKQSEQSETKPQSVTFVRKDENPPREVTLLAGPAHFGPKLRDDKKVTGTIEFANPLEACSKLVEPEKFVGKIVVVSRGNCMFVEKARRIQKAGAIAGIVVDDVPRSSATESPMFAMSGDGREPDDVTIPVVFLFTIEASQLVVAHVADSSLIVTIGDYMSHDEIQLNAPSDTSVLERLKDTLKDFLARQLTPEKSASRGSESRAMSSGIIGIMNGGQFPNEYKIADSHLKAIIFEKAGIVKIVRTERAPPSVKNMVFAHEYEKSWYESKQEIVNKIYSLDEGTLVIPLLKLRYTLMHKIRGLEIPVAVDKIPVGILMDWFLKELSDVGPDTSNPKNTKTSLFGVQDLDGKSSMVRLKESIDRLTDDLDALQRMSNNRMKILEPNSSDDDKKQACESKHDFEQSALSSSSSIMTPLQRTLEKFSDDLHVRQQKIKEEKLQECSDDSILHFKLKEIIDDLKTIDVTQQLTKSLDAELNDFKLSLISGATEATKINPSGELSYSSYITHEEFESLLSSDKSRIQIRIRQDVENLGSHETIERPEFEGFERIWYDTRQFFVNFLHSCDEKGASIPVATLTTHYHAVLVLQVIYQSTSLEQMVTWYLKELRQLRPQPEIVELLRARIMQQKASTELPFSNEQFLQSLAETTKNSQSEGLQEHNMAEANHAYTMEHPMKTENEHAKTRQSSKRVFNDL